MNILRLTVIIILLLIPSVSFADDDANNILHFGYSMVFGVFSETVLHYNFDMSTPPRIFFATVSASVPGLVKEVLDSSNDNGNFNGSDMAFNVAGAFTGSLISSYINNKISVGMGSRQDGAIVKLSFKFQ